VGYNSLVSAPVGPHVVISILYKRRKRCTISCVRYNYFTGRVVKVWNSLPNKVDFNSNVQLNV